MIRRGFIWIVRSLLIGAPVSLALALGVATRWPFWGSTTVTFDWDSEYSPNWLMRVDTGGLGWTRRGQAVVSPHSYGVEEGGNSSSITLELAAADPPMSPFPIALPPGGNLQDVDPVSRHELSGAGLDGTLLIWPIETRFGWPMRCVRYWNDGVYGWGSFGNGGGSRAEAVVGGVTISKGPGPFHGKVLPYEPIVGGLVIDAFVWGGVVTGVWWLVRWVRERGRRSAGLCEKCGYDLAGVTASVCPECGAGLRRGSVSVEAQGSKS